MTRIEQAAAKRGFTIIEVVIVATISAILATITIPRAGRFIDGIEVRGATTEAVSMFSLARHYAIAHSTQATLEIDPAARTLSIKSAGQTITTRDIGTAHGVSISTNRTSVTYSPVGVGFGAANFTMVLSRGRASDTIVVSRLGRVRR
jgi:prepilin-type N-terminal cleavage/methylation domain-containing protein